MAAYIVSYMQQVPALSTTSEYVGADIFLEATRGMLLQVTEWKALVFTDAALGMRYANLIRLAQSTPRKLLPVVMQSTADNVYIGYNTVKTNGVTGGT